MKINIVRAATAAVAVAVLGASAPLPAVAADPPPLPPLSTGPVFNNPAGSWAEQSRILMHLERLINGTPQGETIRISLYLYESGYLLPTLKAAHDRGVAVQVVLDGESLEGPGPDESPTTSYARLLADHLNANAADGSWLRFCNKGDACLAKDEAGVANVNHNKFFLFSRTTGGGPELKQNVVVQSSGNLTAVDNTKWWNDAMTVVDNAALYDAYVRYFDRQAKAAEGGPQDTDVREQDAAAGNAKVYFFPRQEQDVIVGILQTVGRAAPGQDTGQLDCGGNTPGVAGTKDGRTKIRVAQGHFNRPRVAEMLWKLADAGCHVEVVYRQLDNTWNVAKTPPSTQPGTVVPDDDTKPRPPRVSDWLTRTTGKGRIALHQLDNDGRYGIDPLTKRPLGTSTHNKILLVEGSYDGIKDKKIVYTGSHTYTQSALTLNDEALLKYDDTAPKAPVFSAYVTYFDQLRKAAADEGQ
ncbi:phospholipase D-like domain-containing protein [Streptomyces antimicrobicus]|uniref:phospholipase D n=1 Tax=Streptomyces antimicrobicus TaxID=2883108 RepID=A0ABS8B003_9ACTN|nr:phospholipase D-like domain-containing protein [Streptomyces antimicrobicus]MCB5177933.1 phospholipase D-like domain-containing protein [Streptomyces antimicrobicus]